MSEAAFFKVEWERFVVEHPREDGWSVYRVHEVVADKLSLCCLLNYIRDERPDILKRRIALSVPTLSCLSGGDKLLGPRSEVSGQEHAEMESNAWWGSIEVEWERQPIHYHVFETLGRPNDSPDTQVLIAVKSNQALRSFHKALAEYGRLWEKRRAKGKILVINGEDILNSTVSWEDVILPKGMAEDIRTNVESFFRAKETYKELRLPYRRGLLLAGPAGCGKTLTLKALANTVDATFIAVQANTDVDENDLERAFFRGNWLSPAVIVIEDMDRLVRAKGLSISHFLNMLDGLKALEGVLVIATANHPEKLDPALLHRPSRFDRIWKFPLPNLTQRTALLMKIGAGHFSPAALDAAAKGSHGFSMAYVQEIVVNALLDWAHNGRGAKDDCLRKSLETLRGQRKSASKIEEETVGLGNIGFVPSNPENACRASAQAVGE